MELEPHRRQYVIGPKPVALTNQWRSYEISPGHVLSYCPTLPLQTATDADGTTWLLLGLAVDGVADTPPLSKIAQVPGGGVEDLYRSWAGRWLLIGHGELHLDASGLLGCFYVCHEDGSPEWLCSSPALLAEILPERAGPREDYALDRHTPINWFPPPRSTRGAVTHLLPSQVLTLDTGALRHRPFLTGKFHGTGSEETLAALDERITTVLQGIQGLGKQIWLSLTGGIDSRVLLAAAGKAGITARSCTFEYPDMTMADRILPRRLAKHAGFSHTLIKQAALDSSIEALHDQQTDSSSMERNRTCIAKHQWHFFPPKSIFIIGSCFEVGRCFFWDRFSRDGQDNTPDLSQLSEYAGPHPYVSEAFRQWSAWCKQSPEPTLDWRDRFYIEQRLGGWLNAIELGGDLVPVDRIHPLNSLDSFELLLNFDAKTREAGEHQRDLTTRLLPELMRYPVNPPHTYFSILSRAYWRLVDDPRSLRRAIGTRFKSG